MISLSNIIPSQCALGEGLCIKGKYIAWVDIVKKTLHLYHENTYKKFEVNYTPTAILNIDKEKISLISNIGIVDFFYKEGKTNISYDFSNICNKEYRSNDAGYCGNNLLISFMHKMNPSQCRGYVYSYRNGYLDLVDDGINIPNSFIEIEKGKLIVSDSFNSLIWLYNFSDDGIFLEKELWHEMSKDVSPDGGCLISNFIFLTIWDDSSIAVFDREGNLRTKLELPLERPTNCKFDKINKQLWVTSAAEGLCNIGLNNGISNGDTLVYDIDIRSV